MDPSANAQADTQPAPSSAEADSLLASLGRLRGRRGGHRRHGDSGSPGGHGLGHGSRAPRERAGGPALLRMLGALAQAGNALSVSEIAEHVGVDQPRASRLVQQAVELEYAAREADPDDARRTRVRATDAGTQFVHGMQSRQRADATGALSALDTGERAELLRLLEKLAGAWPQTRESPTEGMNSAR